MAVLSLLNPFGWFSGYQAKLTGGNQPGPHAVDGYSTSAGQSVTPENALRLSTYWACVKIIAQTIGTLPLNLFEQLDNNDKRLAVDNPLFDLLRYQPAADYDAVEFWEGVGACLAVWGNSYSLKIKGVGGKVIALEPLRPFWMSVFKDEDGSPVYRYADPYKKRIDYTSDDVFHIRGFGFGDLVGLSPIACSAQILGGALAADETANSLFRNGMKMGGWFRWKRETVLTPKQMQDAREALIYPMQGSSNAGKVGILPGDFDWLGGTMNPVDAELMNNRRMNVEEICRGFGVPPIVVGHITPGQTMWGTGVEHINLAFLTTGLRPYLRRIESAIGRQLIGRQNRKTIIARFDVEELLRTDNKGTAETNAQLVNTGIKTRNEVRKDAYNLGPIDGADVLTVQSALLPIDKLGLVARLPNDKPVVAGEDVISAQRQQDAIAQRKSLLLKFAPDQPRDDHGRWSGSGGGGGSEKEKFSTTVKEVAVAGVLIAGGAIAAAIGGAEVATILFVTEHVAGDLLTHVLITSGKHILEHLGINLNFNFGALFEQKSIAFGNEDLIFLKNGLIETVDFIVEQLHTRINSADGTQKAKATAISAVDAQEIRFKDLINNLKVGDFANA
jgi:HK97 family phage portal protein